MTMDLKLTNDELDNMTDAILATAAALGYDVFDNETRTDLYCIVDAALLSIGMTMKIAKT